MIQNPAHLQALQEKVHATLRGGHSITVLGWEKHHHCDFTRSLPTSMIIFLGSSPGSLPQNSGLFLFTRFIGHSLTNRVKSEKGRDHLYPFRIGTGQIKDILLSCKEFFESAKPPALFVLEETVVKDITPTPMSNDSACTRLLDCLTQPLKRIPQMAETQVNATEKFVASFKQAAAQHIDGLVGSKVVGELRALSGITKRTKHLVDSGLL